MKKRLILSLVLIFSASSLFAMKGFDTKEQLFNTFIKACSEFEQNFKTSKRYATGLKMSKKIAPYVFSKNGKTGKAQEKSAFHALSHCAIRIQKKRKRAAWKKEHYNENIDLTINPRVTAIHRSIGSASYYKRLSYVYFASQKKKDSYTLIVIPVRINGKVKWFLG